jgi:hypothetical protein
VVLRPQEARADRQAEATAPLATGEPSEVTVHMALFLGFVGGCVFSFLAACLAFPLVRSVVLEEAEKSRMRAEHRRLVEQVNAIANYPVMR